MIGWVNISLYEWRGGRRFARLNLNGTHGQRCLRLGRPRLVSRDNREEWGCGILSSPVGWGKTHGIPSFRWVEYSDFLVFSLSTWGRLMTPTTFDSRWYIIRIIPIWQPLRPTGRSGGGNALQKLELFLKSPWYDGEVPMLLGWLDLQWFHGFHVIFPAPLSSTHLWSLKNIPWILRVYGNQWCQEMRLKTKTILWFPVKLDVIPNSPCFPSSGAVSLISFLVRCDQEFLRVSLVARLGPAKSMKTWTNQNSDLSMTHNFLNISEDHIIISTGDDWRLGCFLKNRLSVPLFDQYFGCGSWTDHPRPF